MAIRPPRVVVLGTGAALSNLTCASARLIATSVSKIFFRRSNTERNDSLIVCSDDTF
jgi:hypothetical protein